MRFWPNLNLWVKIKTAISAVMSNDPQLLKTSFSAEYQV